MTKEQMERNVKGLQETVDIYGKLAEAGLIPSVTHVSPHGIYMETDTEYLAARKALRKMFGVKDKLTHYYMSSEGTQLAVTYSYGDWIAVFYFSKAQEMLKTVSKGRCHIEEREVIKIRKTVACEV